MIRMKKASAGEVEQAIENHFIAAYSCLPGRQRHRRYERVEHMGRIGLRCVVCRKTASIEAMRAVYALNGYRSGRSHVSTRGRESAIQLLREELFGRSLPG